MATAEESKVIDMEWAFIGPMGFDVGALIGNLLIAGRAPRDARAEIHEECDDREERVTPLDLDIKPVPDRPPAMRVGSVEDRSDRHPCALRHESVGMHKDDDLAGRGVGVHLHRAPRG